MFHKDERSEVFIVVTFRDDGEVVDLEVLDRPPGWKLWNSSEGLSQRLWVADINGGDGLEITYRHTRLCEIYGPMGLSSKEIVDKLDTKIHLWLMSENLHMGDG